MKSRDRLNVIVLILAMMFTFTVSCVDGTESGHETDGLTEANNTQNPEAAVSGTEVPETEAPETEALETEAPETEAPETEAPETEAPETEAPETEAPETEAPETEAPETEVPETETPQKEEKPKEPKLVSIDIYVLPRNTTYLIGEEIDTYGMCLELTYSDGYTVDGVTDGYTYSPKSFDSLGIHTVTVTYGDKTDTFTVEIVNPVTSGTCGEGLSWTFENGVLTISGNGAMDDYYTYSNAPWYSLRNQIKQIIVSEGVYSVGVGAFAECINLTSVSLPDGLLAVSMFQFYNCSSLKSIDIPESVKTIGWGAFQDCSSLESINISENVTYIDETAFRSCSSLTGIFIDANNEKYSNDEYGVLFNKDKTKLIWVPDSVKCKEYKIPDGVKTIGLFSFYGCGKLTGVIIPVSVTAIEEGAFYECKSLLEITIPGSVSFVSKKAFYGCENLLTAEFCDGVITIGENMFGECLKIKSVKIPKSVTEIGYSMFSYSCGSLSDVYYGGTENDWKKINKGFINDVLLSANIHYNS